MNFTLQCEQEVDGPWIAEAPELPGVLSYGDSAADAMSKAEVLALRVIADRLVNRESEPMSISFTLPVSACISGPQSRQKGVGCSPFHWLAGETSVKISQDSGSRWSADFAFAFHDGEEIGLRMLSRITKTPV